MNKKNITPILVSIIGILIVVAVVMISQRNMPKNVVTNNPSQTAPAKEFTFTSFTVVKDGKYFPQFSTKEITVKKGDLVRLKITNTGGAHDFKIDEFNVYTDTPLNQEMTVEFTADKVGSFVYYCTKPGHRANGHWGTLTVTE